VSVANALAFLRQLRSDEDLRRRLDAAPRAAAMERLCEMARATGKPCLPLHIAEAFSIEWAARRAHFAGKAALQSAATLSGDRSPVPHVQTSDP